MAQQTAVQWLLSELQIRLLKIKSEPDGIVRETMINSFLIDAEQAEAIEKENIAKAWDAGNHQYFCSKITNEDFENEDEMIRKTRVDEDLYNQAIKQIKTR
jgi:hypothetical protein